MNDATNLVDARIEDYENSDDESLQFADQIARKVLDESSVTELFNWLNNRNALSHETLGKENTVKDAVMNVAFHDIQVEITTE